MSDLVPWVVTSGGDFGHFVVVEAVDVDEAAERGVERLVAELPDTFECLNCEAPHFFEIEVVPYSGRETFEIDHVVRRKEER